LIAAARVGVQGITQELLRAGADAALTDHSGKTAYDYAVAGSHDYCARYIANFDLEHLVPRLFW
jgi:ankyrin repeat protein